jgi:hypothetical protein
MIEAKLFGQRRVRPELFEAPGRILLANELARVQQ